MTTLAELRDYDLGSQQVTYDENQTILYALSVGAPATALEYVYERDLVALPTMACAMGLWAVEQAGKIGAYDPHRSLHAAQTLRLHRSLPASGTVRMEASVTRVLDKGSAALVTIVATSEYFDVGYDIFLPGMGGWGGPRGEKGDQREFRPEFTGEYVTPANLAALYRLTGDRHPVHIDPEVARANGFDTPILHGLCTLGVAARVAAELAGQPPHALRQLTARLSAPVTPGDSVAVLATSTDHGVLFEARVADKTVISQGTAVFETEPPVRLSGRETSS
jgi:acyl dehydratase